MAVEEKASAKDAKKEEDGANTGDKKNIKKKKNGEDADDLSPEDEQLKRNLDLLAERAQDADAGIQRTALEGMIKEVRESTSSMTSVPKPLKFLRPHYATLKTALDKSPSAANKKLLADVLSVLAMTMGAEGERESLKYKLIGTVDDISTWGHEYVRNLSGEIAAEFEDRTGRGADVQDVVQLIHQMVPFFVKHNSEPEAIDLLMEVEMLSTIVDHVDESNCSRICLYLEQVARYVPEPEDSAVLRTAIAACRKKGLVTDAVRYALLLGDEALAVEIIDTCEDGCVGICHPGEERRRGARSSGAGLLRGGERGVRRRSD